MGKMKVLILSTNADASGAPNHVLSLVQELNQKIQFFVIFGEDGPAVKKVKEVGVETAIIPEMRSRISVRADLIAFVKVRSMIKSFSPRIVHCHSTKAGMLGRIAAASLGIASIYTVHGWGWRGLSALSRVIVYTIELVLRFTPRSKYIFVSRSVEREGQSLLFIKQPKGVTVYNGLSSFPATPEPDSKSLRILMPARVAKAKDHETLVRAFELLDLDAQLTLCGGDTDTNEFRSLVAKWAPTKNHRITLLGERLDVPDLLNHTNIFALISNFEALPISIIEAMRAKRAIVATDVGGVSELVQDKVSGLLVNKNSVDSVSRALATLADPLTRQNLSLAARNSFERQFLSTDMAVAVFKIYCATAPPKHVDNGSTV